MEVRKATIEDLESIQKLAFMLSKKEKEEYDSLLDLNGIFGEKEMKHYRDRILKNDGCVLVAIEKNKIIGYLCGGLAKSGSFGRLSSVIVAEIETFFVLDGFRSKGIGKKLYDGFVEWSKKKNADKVRLDIHPENELAIKFYRKNDFHDYYLTLERDL